MFFNNRNLETSFKRKISLSYYNRQKTKRKNMNNTTHGMWFNNDEPLDERQQLVIKNVFLHTILNATGDRDGIKIYVFWKAKTFPKIYINEKTTSVKDYINDMKFQMDFFEKVDFNFVKCIFVTTFHCNKKISTPLRVYNDNIYILTDLYFSPSETDDVMNKNFYNLNSYCSVCRWDDEEKELILYKNISHMNLRRGAGFYIWTSTLSDYPRPFAKNSFEQLFSYNSGIGFKNNILDEFQGSDNESLKNILQDIIENNNSSDAAEQISNMIEDMK
jgi:hypothetical protein